MTTIKVRYFVKESGAKRDVSEYVHDWRDILNKFESLRFGPYEPEPDEIEFDHVPGQVELAAAFMQRRRNGQ
jgi:hypothetical protein